MAWTVAAVENELLGTGGRLAAWVLAANDVLPAGSPLALPMTVAGSNAFARGPIRKALSYLGLSPATPPAVTDADLASLGANAEKFLDAATLEAGYSLLGYFTRFDQQAGDNRQSFAQQAGELQAYVTMLENRLRMPYGPNVPAGAMGIIHTGYPLPNDPYRCGSFTPAWTYPYPPPPPGSPQGTPPQ